MADETTYIGWIRGGISAICMALAFKVKLNIFSLLKFSICPNHPILGGRNVVLVFINHKVYYNLSATRTSGRSDRDKYFMHHFYFDNNESLRTSLY